MESRHATFAAGCFWGVQSYFRQIDGVSDVIAGYTGGKIDRPSYEVVCTGKSGHAEAVDIVFDPDRVTYDTLLDHFFSLHDPTQVDRQGPDIGHEYRSAIFPHDAEQRMAAAAAVGRAQAEHELPIATRIEESADFWRAEEYHQDFLEKRSGFSSRMTGRSLWPFGRD